MAMYEYNATDDKYSVKCCACGSHTPHIIKYFHFKLISFLKHLDNSENTQNTEYNLYLLRVAW
jgi:hypothetical protein